MADTCFGCRHWRALSDTSGLYGCHYMLDTGKMRGCPTENCTHYKGDDKVKGKKITPEVAAAMQAARDSGMSVEKVAEQFDLDRKTVCIHTNTPKKSPGASAAAESTPEETKTDTTDIIPETAGDVKSSAEEDVPSVVVDALLEKIESIADKIAEEERFIAALKADKTALEKYYHENCTAFGRDYKRRTKQA